MQINLKRGRTRGAPGIARLLAVGALVAAASAPPAAAHEPLWGETPITFGFGVMHAEARYMLMDAGSRDRMRMFEQEYMVAYGFSPKLNLRLEIPYHNNLHEARGGHRHHRPGPGFNRKHSTFVSGPGDVSIRAKSRISARQGIGTNQQQSVLYGLKLPTGADDHRIPGVGRLEPHSQAGTGNFGTVLGYAWDLERLQDTTWASIVWTRDIGGGFRMGDMLLFDAAYGYWVRPQRVATDLGFNTALGLHGEWHDNDPIGGGRHAGNRHALLGVHLTQMVIRGTHQFRVGVLVPFVRSGSEDHTDFPYEFRAAFETFF